MRYRDGQLKYIILFFFFLLEGGVGCAQVPSFELFLEPDVRRIVIIDSVPQFVEPEDIEIVSDIESQEGLTFLWQLHGPGQLDGDVTNSAVYYVPPTTIPDESAQVTITLSVTTSKGKITVKHKKLTLVKKTLSTMTPTPVPTLSPIEVLLQQGHVCFAEGRFLEPRGDNALEYYQSALDLDPANQAALDKILAIAKEYTIRGDTAYTQRQMEKALENYQQAESIFSYLSDNQHVSRPIPGEKELKDHLFELEMSQAQASPLLFHLGYWYHPDGELDFRPLTEGSILYSGDYYRIVFTPQQDAYVYIYQIDGSGQVFQLFPMERFGGKVVNNFNPVQAEMDYYAPGEEMSFVLDELTGIERIYFVASRERNHFLEDRYEQLQNDPPSRQEALFQELLRQVMENHGVAYAKPEALHGVQDELESLCQGCVYELSFEHR